MNKKKVSMGITIGVLVLVLSGIGFTAVSMSVTSLESDHESIFRQSIESSEIVVTSSDVTPEGMSGQVDVETSYTNNSTSEITADVTVYAVDGNGNILASKTSTVTLAGGASTTQTYQFDNLDATQFDGVQYQISH